MAVLKTRTFFSAQLLIFSNKKGTTKLLDFFIALLLDMLMFSYFRVFVDQMPAVSKLAPQDILYKFHGPHFLDSNLYYLYLETSKNKFGY